MNLTPHQIESGFWSYQPESAFPPPAITYPAEYQGEPRLNLVCTQLDINSYQQRKLVQHWCRLLPELEEVEVLWFNSRTNQAMFDAACQMRHIKGLYVKWGGVSDLSALSHCEGLRYLHLGSSPGVNSISVLATLKQLIVLEIENFKRIRDLEPLGELTQLEGLAVEGSMWTTQIVASLAPLQRLQELRYLFLTNLRSLDGTLAPLRHLKKLVHLRTAYDWPIREFQLLREELSALKYGSPFEDEWIEKFGKR